MTAIETATATTSARTAVRSTAAAPGALGSPGSPGSPAAPIARSMFQRALGRDFGRLHPQLRRRFSVGLDSGEGCVGTGAMDRIWQGTRRNRPLLAPFLAVGDRRNILLAEGGTAVPFRIENYPYLDSHGRETVTFVRTFDLPRRRRRFDATMVYSEQRDCVVDYLGTHQHLAVDLHFAATADGALEIRSGAYRLYEGPLGLRLPRPVVGQALVRESFDDAAGVFRISVRVTNPVVGPVFGYDGSFTSRYVDIAEQPAPASVRPVREETRT